LMRLQARIAVTEGEAIRVLIPLGINADVAHDVAVIRLFLDDPRYEQVIQGLKRAGVHYNQEIRPTFEEEEIATAEFFHMVPRAQWGYPEPEDDWGGRSYDKETACPTCGTGAKQIHPFFVKGPPRFGRGDITALFWVYEFLITDRLKDIIEAANLTGAEIWPIMRYPGRGDEQRLDGCWQLRFLNELPPMSPSMRFPEVRLPRGAHCSCGRIGENIPHEPLRYRREDIQCAKDFNKTSEWLGGGLDTAQLKIVSRRVYEVFTKNHVKGVDFEPITIEES
jgi:hypothetical protein